MRDPKRIVKILNEIEKIWKENPDLRLCQLIGNCFPKHLYPFGDLYYVEDDELETKLDHYYGGRKIEIRTLRFK